MRNIKSFDEDATDHACACGIMVTDKLKAGEVIAMRYKNHQEEPTEPTMDNLPKGTIDWTEISLLIEDMLSPDNRGEKGWKMIKDASAMGGLQRNSVVVLEALYDDLHGFFFKQHGDRHEVWNRMEQYIRTKYSGLSNSALSRVIATYHVEDR